MRCLLVYMICSGRVFMERVLNEMTYGLLELETCSGHVCMKRRLNVVTDGLLELENMLRSCMYGETSQ